MKPMEGDSVQASMPTFVPGGVWPAAGGTIISTNASSAKRCFIINPLPDHSGFRGLNAASGRTPAILSLRAEAGRRRAAAAPFCLAEGRSAEMLELVQGNARFARGIDQRGCEKAESDDKKQRHAVLVADRKSVV